MEKDAVKLAIEHYGEEKQLIVCIEELGELIQALTKYLRYGEEEYILANIAEESADVEIVLQNIKAIFNNADAIEKIKAFKKERILKRMERDKNEQNH